ncbi:MAG: hypothetical protein P4L10_07895 [Acidobacteriaceae bacterium]|nr:hypothetical protein [Acidobacteriaceae bacterium]
MIKDTVSKAARSSLQSMKALSRPFVGWTLAPATHIDALVLDPPGADVGSIEELARQIYL